ncbi:methyl-accepting chemotaxis protein [Glaciecola sp. KUL10]|nr:methyl-accepting chemotaxis protein [Glaciecola sp. KUL10]
MQAWLSKRIVSLSLAAPVLLFIVLVYTLVQSFDELSQANLTKHAAQLNQRVHALTSNVQIERGMSASFVSSLNQDIPANLVAQRAKVDVEISNVLSVARESKIPNLDTSFISPLLALTEDVQQARKSIDAKSITSKQVIAKYSDKTHFLINYGGSLIELTHSSDSKQKMMLLFEMALLQENAGLERAMLATVFNSRSLPEQLNIDIQKRVYIQDQLIEDLEVLSRGEFLTSMKAFEEGPASQLVSKFRDIAFSRDFEQHQVTSEDWFNAATERINGLSQIKRDLFELLKKYASEASSQAMFIVVLDIMFILLLIIISVAIALVLNLRKKQSQELQEKLNCITSHHDLTITIDKRSNDDLGNVVELINQLIAEFRHDFQEFQNSANEIASASEQGAQSADRTNRTLIEQEQSLSLSLMSAEGVSLAIDEDMKSVSSLTQYAKKSNEMVVDGTSKVVSAVNSIRVTSDKVEGVGQVVEQLNERVDDILKMVDVIRSVADQTNLLALNAAIEAARAGEQGRGFAVVADEVRALAKRTQDTTEEIAQVVDKLNESSSIAFNSIAESATAASESVSFAEEISEVLQQVSGNMNDLEGLVANVAQSAEQQSFSLVHVTKEIKLIGEASAENRESAEQVASVSLELSSVAQQMLDNIKRYKV